MSTPSAQIVAHTAGPWRVNSDLQEIDNITPTLPFGAPRRRVATVHGYDAEYEANARLIAAAPDLLAAARRVWDRYQLAADTRNAFDAGLEELGVAIAKAEGRQP